MSKNTEDWFYGGEPVVLEGRMAEEGNVGIGDWILFDERYVILIANLMIKFVKKLKTHNIT
jgi:hypothetical protein